MESNQKQFYCLRKRHYFNTNSIKEHEKLNPKTQKLVEIIKGTCSICGRNISQMST